MNNSQSISQVPQNTLRIWAIRLRKTNMAISTVRSKYLETLQLLNEMRGSNPEPQSQRMTKLKILALKSRYISTMKQLIAHRNSLNEMHALLRAEVAQRSKSSCFKPEEGDHHTT